MTMTGLEIIAKIEEILDIKLVECEDLEEIELGGACYKLNETNRVIGLGLDAQLEIKAINPIFSFIICLTELQSLNLEDNEISDISFVEHLTALQSLCLANNKISDISFVEYLPELQWLDLRANEISDVFFVGQLIKLQTLDLSDNQISSTSFLKGLRKLKTLRIDGNQINDISIIKNLTELQTLILYGNQIADISPIKALNNLKGMQIDDNEIATLPSWITDFNLDIVYDEGEQNRQIHLGNNPITTPPLEVVKQGNAAIKNYFDQLKNQGNDTIFEAKLMLVGQPGAGKTTLLNKLFDPEYQVPNHEEESTLGIDVRQNWPFNNASDKICKAHIWDFGGQQIQYMLHQFFLTPDCVYVLMAEKRRELTNFDYWLNIISLLGQNSPVVILFNEINFDSISPFIYDEKKYQELFSQLDLQKLDVNFEDMSDGRFTQLTKAITNKLSNLGHMGKKVPARWVDIRNELENRRVKKHIRINEYFEICQSFEVDKEPDQMLILQYFHLLGIVLHFRDDESLCDTLFLDPNWTVDAVYSVLANREIEKCNGFIAKSLIDAIWQDKGYDFEERAKLLQLMLKDNFELCYKLPAAQNSYIVPSLLSPKRPEYQWVGSGNLQFRFQYPFMPKGIVSRLIVRLHEYVDQDRLWQEGAVFTKDGALAEVIEWANPKDGLKNIAIRVAGEPSKRKDLLSFIREDIKTIQRGSFPNLPYAEMVPCCCEECSLSQTPHFFEYSVLERFMKKGKIELPCYISADNVAISDLIGSVFNIEEMRKRKRKILDDRNHSH